MIGRELRLPAGFDHAFLGAASATGACFFAGNTEAATPVNTLLRFFK